MSKDLLQAISIGSLLIGIVWAIPDADFGTRLFFAIGAVTGVISLIKV